MAWRTVLLQNQMRLSCEYSQLKCQKKEGSVTIPVEDITVLVLDSSRIILSTALLNALQKNGVAVVVCDEKHRPCGLYLPYHQHTRISAIASKQANWSLPFRKRCWQKIVTRKILNQAACLELSLEHGAKYLRALSKNVLSGDSNNCEATAARFYWDALFGRKFKRKTHREKEPGFLNSALNYGYAIVRAVVARSITAHGLLGCFGLHHKNELNSFCLADDLMEPLRPLVDHMVHKMVQSGKNESSRSLEKIHRQELTTLAIKQVVINHEQQTLTNASDIMAASLVKAIKTKEPQKLHMPCLIKGGANEQAGG